MVKNIITLVGLFLATPTLMAQVGIGTDNPDPSTNLHVTTTGNNLKKGMLFGQLTTAERDSITEPAKGLIIFNKDEKCLQINRGDKVNPQWECMAKKSNMAMFSNMAFGRYKPIYPKLPGATPLPYSNATPPTYSTTEPMLYGNIPGNGTFASNDLFKIEIGEKDLITYSSIIYNISNSRLDFQFNTVAYHEPAIKSASLNPNQGVFIDGDTRTYHTEAQNMYVTITGPAGNPNVGRKFLIGINIFKEDMLSAIQTHGDGPDKENQSMLTYIFEFR